MTATIIPARPAVSPDTLTDADYREIYDELRSKCSLRKFSDAIGSTVSFAWWSKFERNEAHLEHDRRNELRRAVGLPELPAPLAVTAAEAAPDARVYQIGAAPVSRWILIGHQVNVPLALRLNGELSVTEDAPHSADVTPVTRSPRRAARKSIHLTHDVYNALNAARVAAGMTWNEFLFVLGQKVE